MFVCHVGNPELTHLAKLSAVCWPADTCQWYHKVQDYPSRQYELCCQSIRQGITEHHNLSPAENWCDL